MVWLGRAGIFRTTAYFTNGVVMRHLFLTLLTALTLASAAQAHDSRFPSVWVDDLLIHTPVLRGTPAGAPVAAGYMGIENTGDEDDLLVSASAEIAGEIQLHEMVMSGDVMKMRELDGGIALPAGETIWLKPGGLHLMLMKPDGDLSEGKKHFVTLSFERGGTVTIPFTVAPMSAIRKLGDETHHNHAH